MKVLVTGGAGFIGSHIVDKLIEQGEEVVIIDNLSTGNIMNVNSKAVFYNEDICNKNGIDEIFKRELPQYVIHMAAQIDVQLSINNPSRDAMTNIIGSINILEGCRDYKIKKIIYASSAAAYGNPDYIPVDINHRIDPISFYGISKHVPTYYIKVFSELYGIKYTVLRYSNVYGVRQDPKGEGGVISIFVDKFLKNERPFIFGDGGHTRDFIYVDDIANANIKALTHGDNEIFNVSINEVISLTGLVEMFERISGKKLDPIYSAERKGDIRHSQLENKETIEKLCWEPNYTLEQGLKKTYEYYEFIRISQK
jgi:UDP-glucose 4-epimerase